MSRIHGRWASAGSARPDPAALGAAAAGAVLAVVVMLLVRHVLSDDTYITLGYARNLAEHGHWGPVGDRVSNTATSPLNVWLLAAGIACTGHPTAAVGLVLAGALATTGWCAARIGRLAGAPVATPALLLGVLGTSPLLVSTVGLESYLGCAVLVALAGQAAAGRWVPAAALAAAAVLTRPDLAVPAAALVVGLLPARRWLPVAAAGCALCLPWHLFAWFELGGFVPDTAWLKAGEPAWEGYRFVDGIGLYARDFPAATALTVAVVAVGTVAAAGTRNRIAVSAAAAGWAHFAALAALGTPPYAWYYVPLVALCALAAAAALPGLPRVRARRAATAGMAAIVLVAAGFVVRHSGSGTAPVVYNWASSAQLARVGADVGRIVGDEPVATDLEIGAVAYFCGCRVREMFTDPAVTDEVIRARLAAAGPALRLVLGWNVAHRAPSRPEPTRWSLRGAGPDTRPGPGRWVWPTSAPAHPPGVVVLTRDDDRGAGPGR